MEFDFFDEVLYVAALGAANVDDPVVCEAFWCRSTAQHRSVTELETHLYRLSPQHDMIELTFANLTFTLCTSFSSIYEILCCQHLIDVI